MSNSGKLLCIFYLFSIIDEDDALMSIRKDQAVMSGDLEIQDTSLNICAKRLNMEGYRCLYEVPLERMGTAS